MKYTINKTGYSLVEVLVSIAILMFAIIGPMTIAAQGIKSATFSIEQNTAFFLAQEGVEAMFALKNDDALRYYNGDNASWDWIGSVINIPNGPCSIASNGDSCSFGIDFNNNDLANNFTASCASGSESNCLLYSDGSAPSVFVHSGLAESPYTRIITVTRKTDFAIVVSVSVTWNSRVFGGAQQEIVETTELFNLVL